MPKYKLLICVLSSTLIMPSFALSQAQADEFTQNDKAKQQTTTSTSDDEQTTPRESDDSSTRTQRSDNDNKAILNEEDNKDDTENTEHRDKKDLEKSSNNEASKTDKSVSSHMNQTSPDTNRTIASNEDARNDTSYNIVDSIYDSFKLKQPDLNQLFKPDPYGDSLSLSTLIQRLFNLNSDISDYEQPSSENESENNSEESQTSTSHSNKTEHGDNKSENSADQDENTHDNLTTDKNQTSNTQDENNANAQSKQSDDNITDSTLDAILDQYSKDATNTQRDYQTQKDNKNEAPSTTKEDASSETNNPQLPSSKALEQGSKPVQSFENHISSNDIRSTSLFQEVPNFGGNDTTSSFNVVDSKDTRDFIKSIAKDAHQISQSQDIYASVMIAQAILESDSGRSALAQSPNFNLFGIKGNYQGQSSSFNTLEAFGNNMVSINAGFRKYPNKAASLKDYADLIKRGIDGNPNIYKPTWKSQTTDYQDATSHLARTYATDPNYATKLNSLIKHYKLTQFDNSKMPNLNQYTQSIDDEPVNSSEFKPFEVTGGSESYPQGQCTWYVYHRMQQFGLSISDQLGDAHHWNDRAESLGYEVSHTPQLHSAAVFEAGQLGADSQYGHVAFVEKVNKDGSIIVSESNVKGLGIISYRVIDAEDAAQLDYVKGK